MIQTRRVAADPREAGRRFVDRTYATEPAGRPALKGRCIVPDDSQFLRAIAEAERRATTCSNLLAELAALKVAQKIPPSTRRKGSSRTPSLERDWRSFELPSIMKLLEDAIPLAATSIAPVGEDLAEARGMIQPGCATIAGASASSFHALAVELARQARENVRAAAEKMGAKFHKTVRHSGADAEIVPRDWREVLLELPNTKGIHRAIVLTTEEISQLNVQIAEEARVARQSGPSAGNGPFVPTDLQQLILKALDGKALTKPELEVAVFGRKGGNLYKRGGLKELRDREIVLNRRGAGFYRPDKPPSLS